MAYSREMRRDVLEMDRLGATTHEIHIELNVSKSWVRRVKQEFRESGKTAPKTTRDRATSWRPHAEWLTRKVEEKPDVLLRELVASAKSELAWDVSDTTLSTALAALGLTRKKRRSSPPNATAKT